MGTVLAYSSPALGHLYPLSALLGELVRRGHRVHVVTAAAGLAEASRQGFCAQAVDPAIEAIVSRDWLASSTLDAVGMSIEVMCQRAVLEVPDLRRVIARTKPDALIVDTNCWGAMSLAEATGMPWLVFSPFTPYLRSRGVPPFGPGLRPLPGAIGRLRDAAIRPFVTHFFDRRLLPSINTIRMQVAVPPVRSVDELLRRAPLLLAVGGRPLEYAHPDWGAGVHLIGACVFDPQPDTAPVWVPSDDRPIVLVTTSSIRQADAALGRIALEALADEPVQVVATFPAGIPDDLPQARNATVHQFLSHGPVLDRAVCAVTHGGMGVTQRALDRGVPVCVVPFGRDQAEVARRVEVARCGTRLPVKKLTASNLRDKVRAAMTMGRGARRVAAGFAATGGVSRGADLIEQQILRVDARPAAPMTRPRP